MNSADAWHDDEADGWGIGDVFEGYLETYGKAVDSMKDRGIWPDDPNGSMTPILEASVEAAKQRHPSGKAVIPAKPDAAPLAVLTAADRCDGACSAGALFRVAVTRDGDTLFLDWCHHHYNKHFPGLSESGWLIVGKNQSLYEELYRTDRSKGGDHA